MSDDQSARKGRTWRTRSPFFVDSASNFNARNAEPTPQYVYMQTQEEIMRTQDEILRGLRDQQEKRKERELARLSDTGTVEGTVVTNTSSLMTAHGGVPRKKSKEKLPPPPKNVVVAKGDLKQKLDRGMDSYDRLRHGSRKKDSSRRPLSRSRRKSSMTSHSSGSYPLTNDITEAMATKEKISSYPWINAFTEAMATFLADSSHANIAGFTSERTEHRIAKIVWEKFRDSRQTPTKLLHPYEIAAHTASGDASMHIADNSVPQVPLTVQATEQAAEVAADEVRVIHSIQDAASNESVLHQPQVAINVNSEMGSIANSVTTKPMPQAALMVSVPKETLKVETNELIPMGKLNDVGGSTIPQPLVVANVQSNTGSGAKNVTDHSLPQVGSIVNASEQTAKGEVKEIIPMGKLNDVGGSTMPQPLVVANVQSNTGSNAKNATVPTFNASEQTVKVEVKELMPIEKKEIVAYQEPSVEPPCDLEVSSL